MSKDPTPEEIEREKALEELRKNNPDALPEKPKKSDDK